MTRIERLAGGLEEPLLVTSLVNVRYLTGFVSSNAAVLVEPAGEATLYTDFRYAEAARHVDGVTFEETPRAVVAALAERLSGRADRGRSAAHEPRQLRSPAGRRGRTSSPRPAPSRRSAR